MNKSKKQHYKSKKQPPPTAAAPAAEAGPPRYLVLRVAGAAGEVDDEPNYIIVPVGKHKCSVDIKSTNEKLTWQRHGFMVVPFYACTYHKVQGMTLDAIVLDPSEAKLTTPQFMVGITRVRSLQHLALLTPVKQTLLRDFGDADVIATYASLREKQKHTLKCVLSDMETDDPWLAEDSRVELMREAVNARGPAAAPLPSAKVLVNDGGKRQKLATSVETKSKASTALAAAPSAPRVALGRELIPDDNDEFSVLLDKLVRARKLGFANANVARVARMIAQLMLVHYPHDVDANQAIGAIAGFEEQHQDDEDDDEPVVDRNNYQFFTHPSILKSVSMPHRWLVDHALGRYAQMLQPGEGLTRVFFDTEFANSIRQRTPGRFVAKWETVLPLVP